MDCRRARRGGVDDLAGPRSESPPAVARHRLLSRRLDRRRDRHRERRPLHEDGAGGARGPATRVRPGLGLLHPFQPRCVRPVFLRRREIAGVRAVLRPAVDGRGRDAGRAEPGDGRSPHLHALHAEPHAARAARRNRHAHPRALGARRCDHPARGLRPLRAVDSGGDGHGSGPLRSHARDGEARGVRARGARFPGAARLRRGQGGGPMVKEVHFFTEMGFTAYPQDEARRRGYNNLMFPNEHFSPERARELYAMYFDELLYATETGFDGVMINEHHNNPLSMMPSVNVIGAVLARTTRKGRIVFLGNVLPIHDNPLRVAEEVAMIDILSGGRVVCGFVRGLGQESIATNTNPIYNRERFDEAHDVIVKAWTTPGPFRWDGRHYDYRVVNPWIRPLQRPHPPIWIPGVVSPESVRWAAEHRYPYVALAPPLNVIDEIYDLYDDVAARVGFTATDEQRGSAIRVSVAGTDEQAYAEGRTFSGQLGTSFGVTPRHWQSPAGYMSREAAQGQRQQRRAAANITPGGPVLDYEEAQATYQIVTGNP